MHWLIWIGVAVAAVITVGIIIDAVVTYLEAERESR